MDDIKEELQHFIDKYYNQQEHFRRLVNTAENSSCSSYFYGWTQTISPLQITGFDELDEYFQKHNTLTFSQYLFTIIQEKKLSMTKVYKKSMIDRRTFSKIKSDEQYHPKKETALCLCIGLKLNLKESETLLSKAGYAFSPCDKKDLIFAFFIEKKHWDIDDINEALFAHNLQVIGQ